MDILGILAIFITPFMAGYMMKEITRQKETSQIETYLIGFFFLFLLQGIIFTGSVFTGKDFTFACLCMRYALTIIYIIAIVIMIVRSIPSINKTKRMQKMKKSEIILTCTMIVVFLLLLLRVLLIDDCLRPDIISETVRTTISTGTMFKYHPLTGQVLEIGLINSKKIITLPLYYAFWSTFTGLEPNFLLYVVITIQTITMTFFASILLMKTIFRNYKEKALSFLIILGLLILSGDYFAGAVSTRLLWNGYSGDVICAVTMIPYLLYCVLKYCQTMKNQDKMTLWGKMSYPNKIFLCLISSIFMTAIATGLLFLIIVMVLAILCCILVSIREGKKCRK